MQSLNLLHSDLRLLKPPESNFPNRTGQRDALFVSPYRSEFEGRHPVGNANDTKSWKQEKVGNEKKGVLENRGEWIQVGGGGEGLQRNESSVGLATEHIDELFNYFSHFCLSLCWIADIFNVVDVGITIGRLAARKESKRRGKEARGAIKVHYFNNRTNSSEPAASDDRKQHPLAVGQDGKEMPKSRLPNNRMCSCSVPGTTQLSTSTNLSSFDEPPTPARIFPTVAVISYFGRLISWLTGFPTAPNSSLIRSIIRRIEGNFLQEGFRFGNEQSKKVIKVYIKRELGRRSMELEMKGTRVKSFKGTRGKHLYPFPLIALLVGEPDLGIDIFSSPCPAAKIPKGDFQESDASIAFTETRLGVDSTGLEGYSMRFRIPLEEDVWTGNRCCLDDVGKDLVEMTNDNTTPRRVVWEERREEDSEGEDRKKGRKEAYLGFKRYVLSFLIRLSLKSDVFEENQEDGIGTLHRLAKLTYLMEKLSEFSNQRCRFRVPQNGRKARLNNW
ncbi:hypothetical protein V1477_003774 [Vespula maculifrons]|uniref:Uncharacterized protein n=1 Tax=Vespula maculifrons TaxID=7453 RepID=A0ABD2CRX4_VESMC